MSRSRTVLAATLLTLFCIGCGDITSSTGELGRIEYALYTYYEIPGGELTEVSIVTGHTQTLSTDLTDKGEDDANNPQDIEHSVSGGATIEQGESEDDVPTIWVHAPSPGDYTIESYLDGALFDTITLLFDTPVELDAVTWIREPNEAEFDKSEASTPVVPEGTQVAYVPYPLDASGNRIAGVFAASMGADPASSVVTAYELDGIYEDGIWGHEEQASVYFIEPGDITLTMSDEVNGVQFQQSFEVEPVQAR